MYVELSHVSFAFEGGEPLFQDVSARFPRGISALVGENGAGKSTLLELVARRLVPERGVVRMPPDARVLLCEQGVDTCTKEVRAFALTEAAEPRRMRARLGLDADMLARWATLSPGERRRFQLGAALADDPDVLLLDEPTNHVDEAARALIAHALAHFTGVCLLVSHDRTLIDQLAQRTVRIHGRSLRVVEGGYGHAREVWQGEAEQARRQRESARRELKKAERKLSDARRVQASSERGRGARALMRNEHDHDARSLGARTLADWAAAKASRSVSVLRERAVDAREQLAKQRVEKSHGRSVFASYVPCPRPRLLTLPSSQLARDADLLLDDVPRFLTRDARVRVRGPNGAGKSTLLQALFAAVPERERVLCLPQDLSRSELAEAPSRLRALAREERGRVLDMVAALGVDPDRLLASRAPSHGEARKLLLALGMVRGVWALFLDEPTNHLDLPSVERLEVALAQYPGALVVVTHDPTFATDSLRETWTLADGRVRVSAN